MTPISRRQLLGAAAVGAAASVLPSSLRSAAAALTTTGTITDVQHVVILMQENRSFDHYFGTMKGVRGFGDRSTVTIASTNPVFNQANGTKRQYPWELSVNSGIGDVHGHVEPVPLGWPVALSGRGRGHGERFLECCRVRERLV